MGGRYTGVPGIAVSGTGVDSDNYESALRPPPRARDRGNGGRRQPSSPVIPLLLHAGVVGGPEKPPPKH